MLQLSYRCTSAGCHDAGEAGNSGGDMLVITRNMQTVRAVDVNSGIEKSVADKLPVTVMVIILIVITFTSVVRAWEKCQIFGKISNFGLQFSDTKICLIKKKRLQLLKQICSHTIFLFK